MTVGAADADEVTQEERPLVGRGAGGAELGIVGRHWWHLQPDADGLYLQVAQGMRVCATIGCIGE